MLLTIKQFSIKYQIRKDTVYKHIHKGILEAQKIGSVYLIDDDNLSAYQLKLKQLAEGFNHQRSNTYKIPEKVKNNT